MIITAAKSQPPGLFPRVFGQSPALPDEVAASSAGTVISVRIGAGKTHAHGCSHPRDERRVEQLADGTVETNPMQSPLRVSPMKAPHRGFAAASQKGINQPMSPQPEEVLSVFQESGVNKLSIALCTAPVVSEVGR